MCAGVVETNVGSGDGIWPESAKRSTTAARRILTLAGLCLALAACTVKGRPLYVRRQEGNR